MGIQLSYEVGWWSPIRQESPIEFLWNPPWNLPWNLEKAPSDQAKKVLCRRCGMWNTMGSAGPAQPGPGEWWYILYVYVLYRLWHAIIEWCIFLFRIYVYIYTYNTDTHGIHNDIIMTYCNIIYIPICIYTCYQRWPRLTQRNDLLCQS